MKTVSVFIIVFISSLHTSLATQDGNWSLSEAGIRVGTDAENEIDLISYELFGMIDPNWAWDLNESLRLDIHIETAIGGLSGEGETAAYGRIAPVAELHYGDFPVSLVLSSGPSIYSKDTFDQYDLGGHFHFTSSIGVSWDLDNAWTIGYRFQHTSNAHIYDPNPGLDMHALSIALTF